MIDVPPARDAHAVAIVGVQRLRKLVRLHERFAIRITEDLDVARRERPLPGQNVGVRNAGVDRVERHPQLLAAAIEFGIRRFLCARRAVGTRAHRNVVR